MHFTIERTFNAPVERVYQAFTDLERLPEILEGVDSVEPAELGAPLVFEDGVSFNETRTMFGKQHTETMRISDVRPNTGFCINTDSCNVRYAFDHTLTPQPDGTTRFVMTGDGEAYTLRSKIMSVVFFPMKGVMIKAIKKDLDDLERSLTGA